MAVTELLIRLLQKNKTREDVITKNIHVAYHKQHTFYLLYLLTLDRIRTLLSGKLTEI